MKLAQAAALIAVPWGLWAPAALATPLLPYETIPLGGTTLALRPELAGQTIASATRPFELTLAPGFIAPPFHGVVDETVVREFATGTLTFYYQAHLDPGSEPDMPALSVEYFQPTATDVDFLADSSGVGGPGMTARHLGYRDLITFFVGQPDAPGPPVEPGQSSRMFFIRTDATRFGPGGRLFIDYNAPLAVGGVVADAFQPVGVPEPRLFYATGMIAAALLAFRAHRRA